MMPAQYLVKTGDLVNSHTLTTAGKVSHLELTQSAAADNMKRVDVMQQLILL